MLTSNDFSILTNSYCGLFAAGYGMLEKESKIFIFYVFMCSNKNSIMYFALSRVVGKMRKLSSPFAFRNL